MIVIVGESATGKSTVAKYLEDKYSYKRIITYTTRPIRSNEVDGVDYHFITKTKFYEMENAGLFAESASYNGWMYGSLKKDYEKDNAIAVLTPKGLRQIKKNGVNVFSVYLTVPRRDRLIKCLQRDDDIEEAYRRNLSDVGQFDGVEDEVDYVISNDFYYLHPESIAERIIKYERI